MRGCKRFMTKVKLRDATKELLKDAEAALNHVSAMRKNASELAQAARKLETQFVREEEQQRAKAEQAEQERLARQHTKAFTMPDTDEPEAPKAAPKPETPKEQPKKEAPKADRKPQPQKPKKEKKPKKKKTKNPEMNSGVMNMIGGFSVLRFIGMLGMRNVTFTKEELLKMNAALNKIRKPKN